MKDKLNHFKYLFLKVLKFEVFYKIVIFMVISPLINKILQIYLDSKSKGIAFNQYILFDFLSLEGILVAIIIFIGCLFTVIYEISVITNMVTLKQQGQDFRIYDAMKTSLLNLKCLKHPSIILAGVYFLGILPLVHVGYINSLIPSLKIPNFVFGELSLTLAGNILICLIYGLYFGLYLLLLFVPILMIIKKEDFITSFKNNLKLHRMLLIKERLTMISLIGGWIILENGLLKVLPNALIKNSDFNRYFLKNLIVSSQFRIYLVEYLIVTIVTMALMVLFYQYIITLMSRYEPQLLSVKIDLEFNQLFDQTVLKARFHGNKFIQKLDQYIFDTPFYHHHWGIINLVFWSSVVILVTYLFPNSIYMLIALLIVVILMYFSASVIVRYEQRKDHKEISDDSGWLFFPYRMINNFLNKSKIYQKHPKIVTIILAVISFGLVSMYLEPPMMVHQPWVIGHRGSVYGVENSVGAIKAASDKGADYAEIDVQLSSDGIPVVIHDFDLSRLANKNQKIKEMSAQELSETTIYNKDYTDQIPTLDHLIKVMKKYSKTTGLLIELKIEGDNGIKLAKKIIEVVEKNDYQDQAIFMSLDYDAVSYMQEKRPKWWIGYCIYGSAGDVDVAIWNLGVDFLAIEENRATVSFIEKANRNWVPVYVWSVDDEDKMKQYLELGVSGIITNYPNRGRRAVDTFLKHNYQYYYHQEDGYPES